MFTQNTLFSLQNKNWLQGRKFTIYYKNTSTPNALTFVNTLFESRTVFGKSIQQNNVGKELSAVEQINASRIRSRTLSLTSKHNGVVHCSHRMLFNIFCLGNESDTQAERKTLQTAKHVFQNL